MDFTKAQKSRYLENETFFLQMTKKIHIKGYFIAKNSFVAEVTFKKKESKKQKSFQKLLK